MVMFCGWQRSALDSGIPSDLSMNGEGTEFGVSPPDPAGYLGKVNERASQVESCPWCTAKGLVYGLRLYRINFHESITLCTNPECLFPLVSKPLEEILSSLSTVDCQDAEKRKGPWDEDGDACSKRHKAEEPEDPTMLATKVDLGNGGDTSEGTTSSGGNGAHAGAPARLPGEGSSCHADPGLTDLEHGALPSLAGTNGAGADELQPSGPLRDAEMTGSENPHGTAPMSDRVSSVVVDGRPTAEEVGLLPKAWKLIGVGKEQESWPTVGLEVRSTVELEISPMVKQEVEPKLKLEASPTVEQEVRPTVKLKPRPTVEQEVRPEVEPEVRPTSERLSEELAERLTEDEGEFPMVLQEVGLSDLKMGPTAEAEVGPMVEPVAIAEEHAARLATELKVGLSTEEVSPTVEQEVRPEVEPEVRPTSECLSEELAERLAEDEGEFPMVLQEVGLADLKIGPTAEAEVGPMVEPVAIAEEQAARLASELKVALSTEEVRPTVKLEASPTVEQEVRPTVKLEASPTVEQEVRPTVMEVRPTAEHEEGPAKMIATPSHLFWRNEHNLCWLDTLLVALVHCRALRKDLSASPSKNRSVIQQLCRRYRAACGHVKAQEKMGHEDKIVSVPSAVLNRAVDELEDLRMSAFDLLQPKLKLSLGEEETPVFALPALLRLDSMVEALFQHMFHWDFECSNCGHATRSRCQKTLSTFTGLYTDWHPLRAAHKAQCNNCQRKRQRRKMVLKSLSPVFALHFVEGLPQNNVDAYSFDFDGNHYSINTVIQYDQHLKHFVAWIRDDSGSWLEFDGLKYPQCISHEKLPVPAGQIHIVFWEIQPEGACHAGGYQGNAPAETGNLSMTFPQDDTYIVEALTENRTSSDRPDSSVGSTTLLEAFEGLSHSDIVTLTLVEVKAGTDRGALLNGKPQSPPVATETSPVSSTRTATGGKGRRRSQRIAKGAHKKPPGGTPGTPDGRSAAIDPPSPVPDPPSLVREPPSSVVFPAGPVAAILSKLPRFQSTPTPPKRTTAPLSYKPALKLVTDDSDESGLPHRAAEMFSGFQARGVAAPTHGSLCQTDGKAFKQPQQKPPQVRPPGAGNPALASQKPTRGPELLCKTALPRPARDPKTKTLPLDDPGALRRKLMKKLKKKKELLAALDSLMSPSSPYNVTSTTSQCSSGAGNDELLSPSTTTASNLSPDSTGLLEMLATGQEVVDNPPMRPGGAGVATAVAADWAVPTATGNELVSAKDDFLDELMSGGGYPTSHAENVDFNMLDMFF